MGVAVRSSTFTFCAVVADAENGIRQTSPLRQTI
jgi:hypothetical protein